MPVNRHFSWSRVRTLNTAFLVSALFALLVAVPVQATTPPPNDLFVNAQTLNGSCGWDQPKYGNVGATLEAGEPLIAGIPGGASIWYRWTAPAGGVFGLYSVAFNTEGSSFDTLLAVYTGSKVSALALVASNNGAGADHVSFLASAGTTYSITVDGYKGFTGSARLNWGAANGVSNDCFTLATTLAGTSGTTTGTNVGATLERSETLPTNDSYSLKSVSGSVWYHWVAPWWSDGYVFAFSTCSSETRFDTVLAVFTGTFVDQLNVVARNDDAGLSCAVSGYQSTVQVTVHANTTYWIAVYGYWYTNPGGKFRLYWSQPPNEGTNNPSQGGSSVGQVISFVTTCSDPDGWHDIATIDFEIAAGRGHGNGEARPLWARYDENHGLFKLFDPDSGQWSSGAPGSSGVLSNRFVELRLADSHVVGSGPTGPAVHITWALVFKDAAVLPGYQQYLQITDDIGLTTGLDRVGTWSVRR